MTSQIPNVLLLEDEPQLGEELVEYLSSHGYEVDLGRTIGEAVAVLGSPGPQLCLVVDLRLAREEGQGVFVRIAQDVRLLGRIAHVVVTSGDMEQLANLRASPPCPGMGFLAKPYTGPDLLAEIAAGAA